MNDGKKRRGDTGTRRRGEKRAADLSSFFAPASARPRASASSLRVFFALELPAEVRARAANHIARLREAAPTVRASWEREEKLHITLKFLGEIAPDRVEALSGAAARAAASSQPFTLALKGAGAFPPRGNPRVLWLGLEDSSGALAHLQTRLEEECAAAGFPREARPFHPHLTLARLRAPQGSRELAKMHQETGFEPIGFEVTDLILIQSELGAGGSRYTEVSRHSLATSASHRFTG
jgi:RNA 2',3'-cyclic 3'-phosphodiesterase